MEVLRSYHFVLDNSIQTPVDQLWTTFMSKCLEILDTVVVSRWTSERFSQLWITGQVRRITRRQKRAHSKARPTKSKCDWMRYRTLRHKAQLALRPTMITGIRSYVMVPRRIRKKLYFVVKSKGNDCSGIAPLRRNGITYSDAKAKANVFNEQFVSVFSTETGRSNVADGCLTGDPCPDMDSIYITTTGMAKLLRSLQAHKATGPDGIPTHLSYRIGTVSVGSCLYAHICVHNTVNDTITLRITSTSGSQEWCFKLIHNILIRPKLI